MHLAIVIGSPAPSGRTSAIGLYVAQATSRNRDVVADVVDIATLAFEPADGRAPVDYDASIRSAVETVEAADGVVIVSPVYRGTFAGVLKNFVDILPITALRDKPLALVVVGGSLHHYLGVDYAVRALAAWFGALMLPTSVYLTGKDFDDTKALLPETTETLDALVETLVHVTKAIASQPFAPSPLAARPQRR